MAISPNAARAYAYLVGRGLSPYAAAGMVGNLIAESGRQLNVTALGDKTIPGGSQGIGQWNRDRAAAMRSWKDPNAKDELERQLSYLMHELDTREKAAGSRLRSASDLTGATAGGISFERPAGWTAKNPQGGHNWSGRLAAAQQVYQDQTGKNPTIGGPATPGAPSPTGGTAVASAVPPAPVMPAMPPPPTPEDTVVAGLDQMLGGSGQLEQPGADVAAPIAAPAPAAPAPAPEAPAPQQLPPDQGSAASLMASLLDRKRAERGIGMPPGLLEPGVGYG